MRKVWRYTVHVIVFGTLWVSEQQQTLGTAFVLLPLVIANHHHDRCRGNDVVWNTNSRLGDGGRINRRTTRDSIISSSSTRATRAGTALWFAWWDKITATSGEGTSSGGGTLDDNDNNNNNKKKRKKTSTSSLVNVTIIGIDDKNNNNRENEPPSEEKEKVKRQRQERQKDFEARKAAWEAKYGSAEALCKTFGGCANCWWGDLDGEATRQLYHTLLPRSLWALQEADILQPEELAPLAYQARVAAKEYARMRSNLPNRLLAMAFDGYRSWKRDGNPLNTKGLSWEDLWDKYEAQIVQEECASELKQGKMCLLDRQALTKRIYLRILERSCATNQAFDRMFLTRKKSTTFGTRFNSNNQKAPSELGDLETIARQLDHDVREILLKPEEQKKMRKSAIKAEKQRIKAERKATEHEEKAAKKEHKLEKREQKRLAKEQKKQERMGSVAVLEATSAPPTVGDDDDEKEEEEYDNETKRAQYNVLRIAANTRRKFRDI